MTEHRYDTIRAIRFDADGLELLDQRLLPERMEYLRFTRVDDIPAAIRNLVVRGAPAIGITVAYAAALSGRQRFAADSVSWKTALRADLDALCAARPTAVNARWAAERMWALAESLGPGDPGVALLAEARRIHEEDVAANYRIGELGRELIGDPPTLLTHCNAGALATGGYGTALGIVRAAAAGGRLRRVFVDETRPWLQGARLTAWELVAEGIAVDVIPDSAAAHLLARGECGAVVVGADRIAANGDVANKIGTYPLALAARANGVPFVVAAPCSTVDMSTPDGTSIPIEERSVDEVLNLSGRRVAAQGVHARNPVFDITPAALVTAIVTERGAIESPNRAKLAALFAPPPNQVNRNAD